MKKRLISLAILAAFSLGFLALAPERAEVLDYDVYFQDNTGFDADEVLFCYAETPWADARNIDLAELLALGAIPDLTGYDPPSGSVLYNEDGSIWEIQLIWQYLTEDYSTYKQLILSIIPGDLGDPQRRDGLILPEEDKCTKTVVGGVTVWGVGTPSDLCQALVFTKDGVRYQMDIVSDSTQQELGTVLDFYLKQDLDLSVFQ
jgi:hypothetical protein